MKRRGFLQSMAAAFGIAATDPEELLWTRKKTIFIPSVETKLAVVEEKLTIIGYAMTNIMAGHYGSVLVYGPTPDGNEELFTPIKKLDQQPRLVRRVRALQNVKAGSLATNFDVDYGNAPPWYPGVI